MRLYQALRIDDGEVVAFTGAGGKTAALFRLADDLAEHGRTVLSTNTVRVGVEMIDRAPRHFSASEANRARVEAALDRHAHLLVTGPVDRAQGFAAPVSTGLIEDLLTVSGLGALLIKADSANRRLFKAPVDTEPEVPPATTLTVVMANLETIGESLIDLNVQNAARVAELAGIATGDDVTADVLTRVLLHPEGGLKGVPESSRVVVFLNRVDLPRRLEVGRGIAARLLAEPRISAVALGTARKPNAVAEVHGRVAAVVLAAGRSTRMGRPKMLLEWPEGGTILGAVITRLRSAAVSEIVVVTGAEHEAVEAAALAAAGGDARVRCVHNPDYATAEMGRSLQVGLRSLTSRPEAALVALGDQPLMPLGVIADVIQRWRETLAPAVAPVHGEQRGHPLLLDRAIWPRVQALAPEANPRQALVDLPVEVVVAPDNDILLDIDTPDDYARARAL
ncbi:MAG TPA: selenium cofactor biosynthesis protein YqeC [Anaerolineales bacterium]|nr:selenium cofactor biosynthesis protein YqeC [Anaerolineales bacterium]